MQGKVLPTLGIGFLLPIPTPVFSGSQALVYVSPFARNTLPALLGLVNYSSFKTHLWTVLPGRINHCLVCASTGLYSDI